MWTGAVTLLPEGDIERFGITIAPTGFSTINPEQYEFDYTLGKIAHFDFGIAQVPLANVAIDYLHRKIAMSDAGSSAHFSVSVEATLDFATNHLKGYVSALYGGSVSAGRRGVFDLTKLKDGE